MEPVTHYCGYRIWRHETGGAVSYTADGTRQIDRCPNCGQPLHDSNLRDASGRSVPDRRRDEED